MGYLGLFGFLAAINLGSEIYQASKCIHVRISPPQIVNPDWKSTPKVSCEPLDDFDSDYDDDDGYHDDWDDEPERVPIPEAMVDPPVIVLDDRPEIKPKKVGRFRSFFKELKEKLLFWTNAKKPERKTVKKVVIIKTVLPQAFEEVVETIVAMWTKNFKKVECHMMC